MKTHELKIWPEYFAAVADGRKTFEFRKNDRNFCFGDKVVLREWVPEKQPIFDKTISYKDPHYTGRELTFRIGYILPVGEHVIFSLLDWGKDG